MNDGNTVLNDYKVLCFNGEPKLIEVHSSRWTKLHTQDFYTTEWERTEIEQKGEPMSVEPIQAPKLLHQMLNLSKKLSEGFIHIRVDWYVVSNQLYFGELTFYDGSGFVEFTNDKWDYMLGEWIKLPERRT